MGIELNLFPKLSEELLEKVGFLATDYGFGYHINGLDYDLEAKPVDGQAQRNDYLQISDERCQWVPDSYDLSITRKYTLHNSFFLFGESGIACEDAELGLAIMWTSKSSNQRGVKEIGGFRKRPGTSMEFSFECVFPPGQLKGSLSLQTILFLKSPGQCKENERHLANSSGMILGTLDEYIIIIDGNGSVFPIVEVEEPSKPLWWVTCEWTDPQVDSFAEENVTICLNKAHANYHLLKLDDGLKQSPMLMDIIASALQIIIQKVKENECWEEIISGHDFEHGSIAHAVHYFITTFDWDPSSPEHLALTIRRDFDSRILEGLR